MDSHSNTRALHHHVPNDMLKFYAVRSTLASGTVPGAVGRQAPLGFVADNDKDFEQHYDLTMDTERRLEFVVSTGNLGLIIDTPDDVPHLVHAVKTGSVIDDKVHLGDLLMAVNDQNVMDWSAVQISKFIAARSVRRRTLVCWRQHSRKRTKSSMMLEGDGV
jgi:hypothetical protein